MSLEEECFLGQRTRIGCNQPLQPNTTVNWTFSYQYKSHGSYRKWRVVLRSPELQEIPGLDLDLDTGDLSLREVNQGHAGYYCCSTTTNTTTSGAREACVLLSVKTSKLRNTVKH